MRRHQGFYERPQARTRGWDGGYDPRMDEYFNTSNIYKRGPGSYLAAEHQPYNIQAGARPYKLLISGIHQHTTEDGIFNILREYGTPLSVNKPRNSFSESIAFVEFASQREADSAIINLDRKAPLYWSVTYANTRKERHVDPLTDLNEVILGELKRQTPRHLSPSDVTRQTVTPIYPGQESSTVFPRNGNMSLYPPCTVCGTPAKLVCTVCKTRYCSESCQSGDWPTHRNNCLPPPVLEMAQPSLSTLVSKRVPYTATVTELPPSISGTQVYPNQSEFQVNRERNVQSLVNPQPSVIEGIRTLGINEKRSPSETTKMFSHGINSNVQPVTNVINLSPNFKPNGASPRDEQLQLRSPQSNSNQRRNPGPQTRNHPIKNINTQKTPPNNPGLLGAVPSISGRSNPGLLGAVPSISGRSNPVQVNSPKKIVYPRSAKIYAHVYDNTKLATPPSSVPVTVCYVKSPSEFFVQYKRFNNHLVELMAAIQDSAEHAIPLPASPSEMSPCLAIFPDDRQWYRARVLKLFDDGIGVGFVDYGNTMKMTNTRECLRQMEIEFSKAPFYAVRAKLVDLEPIDETNTWPQLIKEKFKQLVELNDFVMDLVRTDEDGIMCVRLKNSEGIDIGQMLVTKGVAKSVSSITQISGEPHSVSKPLTVASKPKEPECVLSGDSNPGPTPVSSPRRPPMSASAALLRAARINSRPLPDSSTGNRSIIKLLKPGDVVALTITTAWNESSGSAGYLFRPIDLNDVKAFDYHTFVVGVGAPVPGFDFAIGSLISALSPEHGQWFRGCILEANPTSYSVLYIDFGNVEKGVVTVKPIPDDYKDVELGVKISFGGNLISAEAKKYTVQHFNVDSDFELEIVSLENDGSVLGKLKSPVIPDFRIKLESWTALFQQLKSQQSPVPVLPLEVKYRPLEAGFNGDVIIHVAEGLDRIFAQVVCDDGFSALTKIEEILNDLFPKSKAPATPPTVGTYVAAIYTGEVGFYRARVTAVEGTQLTLEYIDYGNTGKVQLSQVRLLSNELYQIPCCTYRLDLSLICHPEGMLPAAVKTLLNSLPGTICSILVVKSTDGLIECILSKDGRVINDTISDLIESSTPSVSVEAIPSMPKLKATAPEEAKIGSSAGESVDNTLGTFLYQDGPFYEFPKSGSFTALVLTNDTPPLFTVCPMEMDALNKLAQMDEDISTYVGTLPLMKFYEPEAGEVCLARSPDDGGLWCRSACLQVVRGRDAAMESKFEVIQVDYGKIVVVAKNNILRIPKRFITFLPYMALQTVMKEFEETFQVTEKVAARLAELMPDNSLVDMSVVRYANEIYTVDIPSISSVLKAEGLV